MKLILVVDMLKGFYNMGMLANPRVAGIIPNIRDLLERKRQEGYSVLFLADRHKPDDKEFARFPAHCVEGTVEAEVIDELKEFIGMNDGPIVFSKTRFSGFYGTYLDEFLEKNKPTLIIVVGVCADICVFHTVAGLVDRDYRPIIPRDCIETYDAPDHNAEEWMEWVIRYMQSILGATVVDSQKAI